MNPVKHPRMYHLPWSLGATDDDLRMKNTDGLAGNDVIITEKMDGECTTIYRDFIHARSLDSGNHLSRTWVKNLWSQIAHDIPDDIRICGENLYAEHSIHYSKLPTFFMVHSIWEDDLCLSWGTTKEWCELLGLQTVPELSYPEIDPEIQEGYVIRVIRGFPMEEYPIRIGKYVREDHVTTDEHWTRNWIPNELA